MQGHAHGLEFDVSKEAWNTLGCSYSTRGGFCVSMGWELR